jgi:hypothetical protein
MAEAQAVLNIDIKDEKLKELQKLLASGPKFQSDLLKAMNELIKSMKELTAIMKQNVDAAKQVTQAAKEQVKAAKENTRELEKHGQLLKEQVKLFKEMREFGAHIGEFGAGGGAAGLAGGLGGAARALGSAAISGPWYLAIPKLLSVGTVVGGGIAAGITGAVFHAFEEVAAKMRAERFAAAGHGMSIGQAYGIDRGFDYYVNTQGLKSFTSAARYNILSPQSMGMRMLGINPNAQSPFATNLAFLTQLSSTLKGIPDELLGVYGQYLAPGMSGEELYRYKSMTPGQIKKAADKAKELADKGLTSEAEEHLKDFSDSIRDAKRAMEEAFVGEMHKLEPDFKKFVEGMSKFVTDLVENGTLTKFVELSLAATQKMKELLEWLVNNIPSDKKPPGTPGVPTAPWDAPVPLPKVQPKEWKEPPPAVKWFQDQWDRWFGGPPKSLPLPHKQGGGPVSRGQPYIVGEHGPELFVPGTTGGIVPNTGAPSGQLTQLMLDIAGRESAGYANPYGAINPKTRALGKYQVMPFNIGPWTREVLGYAMSYEQFKADPQAQERVAAAKLTQYLHQFGFAGAKQAWFGGPGAVGHLDWVDANGMSVGRYSGASAGNAAAMNGIAQATAGLAQAAMRYERGGITIYDTTGGSVHYSSAGMSPSIANIVSVTP